MTSRRKPGQIREFPNSFDVVASEIRPGLQAQLETLKESGSAKDPRWVAPDVPLDKLLKFTYQTGIQWSERTPSLLSGERAYEDFILAGGIHDLIDRMKGFRVVAEEERRVWVPVAEIHHPSVKDCKAWLEHGAAVSRKRSAELKLLGWGGGTEARTGIELTDKITLDEPGCTEVLLPITVKAQLRESAAGKRTHVDIVDVKKGSLGTRGLDPGSDRCGLSEAVVRSRGWRVVPIPLVGGKGRKSFSEKVGIERGYNGSAGLDIGGLSAKVEASVTWSETVGWGYELVLGREYLAYRPNYATGLMWSRTRANENVGA